MTFARNLAEQAERKAASKARNLQSLMQPSRAISKAVMGRIEGAGVAVPKGEKAKPGKRAPNKEEREWMDKIVAFGCIACHAEGRGYVAPCVHHILRGGRRMGHLHTLPLCPGHHQDGTGIPGLIARHPYKAQFEARYGTEARLLERLQEALEWTKEQQGAN